MALSQLHEKATKASKQANVQNNAMRQDKLSARSLSSMLKLWTLQSLEFVVCLLFIFQLLLFSLLCCVSFCSA